MVISVLTPYPIEGKTKHIFEPRLGAFCRCCSSDLRPGDLFAVFVWRLSIRRCPRFRVILSQKQVKEPDFSCGGGRVLGRVRRGVRSGLA